MYICVGVCSLKFVINNIEISVKRTIIMLVKIITYVIMVVLTEISVIYDKFNDFHTTG